ncbi:hypothetical protein LCGC14_3089130 [marine sediment metagenome]|uniref:Uncharacterized protein n=1 Tax=marine sediment metagenome TaxID=412755 RepID=A0A0F8WZR1_9ZZZZ
MSEKFKEGDPVHYRAILDGPLDTTVHRIRAIEYAPNNYGCDVAWITGHSGCVGLRFLVLADCDRDLALM